jgi:hypothetical protein
VNWELKRTADPYLGHFGPDDRAYDVRYALDCRSAEQERLIKVLFPTDEALAARIRWVNAFVRTQG